MIAFGCCDAVNPIRRSNVFWYACCVIPARGLLLRVSRPVDNRLTCSSNVVPRLLPRSTVSIPKSRKSPRSFASSASFFFLFRRSSVAAPQFQKSSRTQQIVHGLLFFASSGIQCFYLRTESRLLRWDLRIPGQLDNVQDDRKPTKQARLRFLGAEGMQTSPGSVRIRQGYTT